MNCFNDEYLNILDEDNYNEYVTLLGAASLTEKEKSNSEPESLGPISSKHLLVWAHQIAKGMEYLGSMKASLTSML